MKLFTGDWMRLCGSFDIDTRAMNHIATEFQITVEFSLGGVWINVIPVPMRQ